VHLYVIRVVIEVCHEEMHGYLLNIVKQVSVWALGQLKGLSLLLESYYPTNDLQGTVVVYLEPFSDIIVYYSVVYF
jgi:hypothetical protein